MLPESGRSQGLNSIRHLHTTSFHFLCIQTNNTEYSPSLQSLDAVGGVWESYACDQTSHPRHQKLYTQTPSSLGYCFLLMIPQSQII